MNCVITIKEKDDRVVFFGYLLQRKLIKRRENKEKENQLKEQQNLN